MGDLILGAIPRYMFFCASFSCLLWVKEAEKHVHSINA